MIDKIIHRFLLRRHFWRYANFSEIAELYASRTLRIFALRMVAVFTTVYLLQLGYSLAFIALFLVIFFGYKTIVAIPAGQLIGYIGPKHATLMSNVLSAVSLLFLPLVPDLGIGALAGWLFFQATSSVLYDLAYMIDFSKVKHVEHAGKEIAYMNILEKVATAVSPVIGGGIAFWAGPEVAMIVAAVLFLLAALPLLQTAEPVAVHQKLSFKGFPWKTTRRSIWAEVGVGIDATVTGNAWVLFLALFIFTGLGDDTYAKVGLVSAVSIITALLASYSFGKFIDHNKGGELLRTSVWANTGIHLMRGLVSTPIGVVLVNILNEAATTGYAMPFLRGLFDTADRSGKRLAYLSLVEIAVNVGAALAAFVLWACVMLLESQHEFMAFFVITGLATLIIGQARFVLYKK